MKRILALALAAVMACAALAGCASNNGASDNAGNNGSSNNTSDNTGNNTGNGDDAAALSGTVDSFPLLTGEVAMEVALRIVGGQDIPRVVATPQALITKDNVAEYSISDSAKLRELLLSK